MEVTGAVRVRPGASATRVGGAYGEGDQRILVVRVCAPAVDGRATEAVLRALAEALEVSVARVRLVRGATSRTKTVGVTVDSDTEAADVRARWEGLLQV